ncbi:BamA/TamA family outer membrane protein [Arenimonas aestuarii]
MRYLPAVWALLLPCLLVIPQAADAAPLRTLPDDAALETAGAVIGDIRIVRHDIFDTSLAEEDAPLYRAANALHRRTREPVVRRLLLVEPGMAYSRRLLDETERLLRAQNYLREAKVTPVHFADGRVDLLVETWDAWTLNPGISGSRSGGASSFGFELEDSNLLGTGAELTLSHDSDSERNENALSYRNDHLFGRWNGLDAELRDNSDGRGWALALGQPFHALDTRRAWGVSVDRLTQVNAYYSRGEDVAEYRQRNNDIGAWWGRSAGLRNGRVTRWQFGLRDFRRDFLPARDPFMAGPVPADRHLAGPWIGIERIHDDWQELVNLDQIGSTEDVLLGLRWSARLGWSDTAFGGDRDALWLETEVSRGFRLPAGSLLRTQAWLDGRLEDGSARDLAFGGRARYYRRTGEKRLFYADLETVHGHALDLDDYRTLGGDNGLRGYPERWASGEGYTRLSLEQRYYTDAYLWRIFRVGGAVFMDVGRTWGDNPLGEPNPGTLADVGFGLRLGNTRSAFARVVHVDLAFPLDGDPSLKRVELVIEARREF